MDFVAQNAAEITQFALQVIIRLFSQLTTGLSGNAPNILNSSKKFLKTPEKFYSDAGTSTFLILPLYIL